MYYVSRVIRCHCTIRCRSKAAVEHADDECTRAEHYAYGIDEFDSDGMGDMVINCVVRNALDTVESLNKCVFASN